MAVTYSYEYGKRWDARVPRDDIRWVVNRLHVSTTGAEIAADIERRCTAPGYTPRIVAQAVAYALICHQRNQALADAVSGHQRNRAMYHIRALPPVEDPSGEPNMKTYRYRLLYRPVSFSTLPPGLGWRFAELPADDYRPRSPEIPRSRHRYGVIETDRELTQAELETFQIEVVP